MELLKDRLQWAMDRAGVSQAALARACRIKPPSVSAWLSGRTKTIEGENLVRAALKLKVSPYWLATGRGSHEPLSSLSSREDQADYLLGQSITSGLASQSHSLKPDPQILAEAEQWVRHEEGELVRQEDGTLEPRMPYPDFLSRAERLSAIYELIAVNGMNPAIANQLFKAAEARLQRGDEDERRTKDRGSKAANG